MGNKLSGGPSSSTSIKKARGSINIFDESSLEITQAKKIVLLGSCIASTNSQRRHRRYGQKYATKNPSHAIL
jgi:hypothetical protein